MESVLKYSCEILISASLVLVRRLGDNALHIITGAVVSIAQLQSYASNLPIHPEIQKQEVNTGAKLKASQQANWIQNRQEAKS